MSSENKNLVLRWFQQVWNEKRASTIDELLAADGKVHGLGEPLIGPAAFKPFHAAYLDAFPDLQIKIDDIIAEGNTAAFRWSATATHHGHGLGIAATGKQVRFEGMGFARFGNGKIIEAWNTFDQMTMLEQVGFAQRPG
jgi:steroid delta-isomerase-like uncharacterized protein